MGATSQCTLNFLPASIHTGPGVKPARRARPRKLSTVNLHEFSVCRVSPSSKLKVWLARVGTACQASRGASPKPEPWFVEAHQFRIDTTDGIGRPTPEGAHRDGVDFVAVFMVERANIKGGETRVFDASGTTGERFTLMQPWSLLLLDDAKVIHESTPIQPLDTAQGAGAHRDTLVVTLRRGGFQGG